MKNPVLNESVNKMSNTKTRPKGSASVALVLLLLPCLQAPLKAEDVSGSKPIISAESIRKHIDYLASDALKGRGSGEPGNEKAAQLVANEFKRAGLKPLGTRDERNSQAAPDGSGYFQPFDFIAGRAFGKSSSFTILPLRSKNGKSIDKRVSSRLNQDFEPSGISAAGKAEGEVVFVGFGIRAPQANHDDYAGIDVKDKIVLLLAGNPRDDPHSPLTEFADIRRKALTARELGAKAVLVILPDKPEAGGSTHFDLSNASDAGLPVLRIHHSFASGWFGDKTLELPGLQEIETLANDDKIVSRPMKTNVVLNADVKTIHKTTANVIGMIEGSDPDLKNERLVIGAHLDHLGLGGSGSLAKSSEPQIHHGADDNASGTAGVMELAQYFGKNGAVKPKRSIIFMCFSGEELGLYGSDWYVKHPILPLENTVAMLNMDMIGRLRDNKLIVIGSGTAKEWDRILTETNAIAKFTMAKSEDGFGASDQQSFYTKNVPVLFFFTGSHADYHTPTDTSDKIDSVGESRVVQLVAMCAERIADSPTKPTFQAIKVPSPGGNPGFRVYFGSIPDYAAQVEGVQLNGVREGSPADKGGLKAGDIIVKFGEKVVKSVYDYTYALQDYKPGDVVKVVIKRGSETLTLTVTLAARRE